MKSYQLFGSALKLVADRWSIVELLMSFRGSKTPRSLQSVHLNVGSEMWHTSVIVMLDLSEAIVTIM
jgi:hypothetical protein